MYANPAFCARAGHEGDSLVGTTLAQASPADYAALHPYIQSVLNGEAQTIEVPSESDGDGEALRASLLPHYADGEDVSGFLAVLYETDKEQELERRYERFVHACDQGQEGFALHDAEGLFTYVNPSQANMYGYDEHELIGESWQKLYNDDQVQLIEGEYFPILLETGKWHGELKGRRKDGNLFDVELSLTLLTDDDGNPAGLVCNCSDITDRKIAEESMMQLQKMDALGKLTGGIAHDFNNLLSVIVSNVELLAGHSAGNTVVDSLAQRALDAAQEGAQLVRRLLAFARNQPLSPDVLDLGEVVHGMRDMLERTLEERIRISLQVEPDVWLCRVDRNQIVGAVLNLAINARDAMPQGGELHVEVANVVAGPHGSAGETEYVRLSVRDTGVGMSDEVRRRMFDPFFTTKDSDQGSGLGLSMVHGLIAQSGGRIEVDSKAGSGTCISILLPRHHGSVEVSEPASSSSVDSGDGRTVLVVEDRRDLLIALKRMLSELNYHPIGAHDAESAKQVLETGQPIQHVLTDIVLPGECDGRELLSFIRQHYPKTTCVAMTGYSGDADGDIDASSVLQKPFTASDLARALRSTTSADGVR